MNKTLSLLVFICLLTPKTLLADIESWYTYWAIGVASHDYPSDLEAVIDAAESIPGVERSQPALDIFGFYWPVNNNTTAGFVISGSGDRLQDRFDDYFQINQYLYGLSGMHFFGKEIGDGFFVRGDIGISKIIYESNFLPDEESDNGTGYLLGGGFGVPISSSTRILFSLSHSNKTIEGDSYKSTTLTIGGLW